MISEELKSNAVIGALEQRDASSIEDARVALGEIAVYIAPDKIVDVCRFLKGDREYRLASVTGLDWHTQEPRFEIVYHLHSITRNERLRLKCRLSGEKPEIDSVTGVWRAANWYEREVFDLFGVTFRNHPDMRRIMMPDEWVGFPLRKDYPVHGYKYSYQDE